MRLTVAVQTAWRRREVSDIDPLLTRILLAILLLAMNAGGQTAFLNHPTIIDACQYGDAAAAQAAWEPMTGTAPANVATREGKKVLALSCNFAGTQIERASWDRKSNLDLTACRGSESKELLPLLGLGITKK